MKQYINIKTISKQWASIGIYSLFILFLSFFSFIIYYEEKTTIYDQFDDQLLSIAKNSVLLLPKDFHDRATNATSILAQEDLYNISRLSQSANNFNVTYIYTLIQKNGHIYFTSSSATEEEVRTGKNMTHYFDLYDDASPTVIEAFRTQKIHFVEESDKWGTFRSVLVPLKSPNGHIYIAGADIRADKIHKQLYNQSIHHFLFAFGLIFISFPIFLWRHKYIKNLAFFDTLTGLPNRIAFKKDATYALKLAQRNSETLAIMFLDLDGFKNINDTLGHSIGDKLLQIVAKRLQTTLRNTDIPSRQGGDEFVILLQNTDHTGAAIVAQKILDEIAKPYNVFTHQLNVTFSIGIALSPDQGSDLESLMKNADIAMYKAKNEGRNCYRFFAEPL